MAVSDIRVIERVRANSYFVSMESDSKYIWKDG